MKQITCEMCGSTDLVKQDGVFVCQNCGSKYSVEEAKKLMIEGPVDVSGSTVKVDVSDSIENLLNRADQFASSGDYERAIEYYEHVLDMDAGNLRANNAVRELALTGANVGTGIFVINVGTGRILKSQYKELEEQAKTEKIAAIKVLREATGLGLAQAKYMIENYRLDMPSEEREKVLHNVVTNNFSSGSSDSNASGGCYVATAVYGSYDCPQVWTLRRYRDYTLAETWYGRAFIRTYYAVSPTLVKWFGHTEWFRKMWRGPLDRMVADLQTRGVESTPYRDREW